MKILLRSITVASLSAAAWLSADIAPSDAGWPDAYPDWWYNQSDPANGVINATKPVLNLNNNAILNQGQLWNITDQAIQELDLKLAPIGGAGFSLSDFNNGQLPDYFAPANLGQLKNISSKFYDLFAAIGFDSTQLDGWPTGLVLNQSTAYPWAANQTPENLSPTNLGQAKHLFSWDLTSYLAVDIDGDFPDWWEYFYTGGIGELGASPADQDGDGVDDVGEFTAGTDPTDFYNGNAQSYQITVVSASVPTGVSGSLATPALELEIRDQDGVLVENAPVYLKPQFGSAMLTPDSAGSGLVSDLLVHTDANGIVTVYIQP